MFKPIRETVRRIPRGKVATYGQVAKAAGFPGAARQVVWALRGARGIPWHRVIGAGGRILLREPHASLQQRLLESEGVGVLERRVDLAKHLWAPPGRAAAKRKKPRSGIRN